MNKMLNSALAGPLRKSAACLLVAALGGTVGAFAQGAAGTVWSGVYADDQAARGKALYSGNCAACHGDTLGGGDSAPSLAGSRFLNSWNATSAGDLFERIHTTMPASDPGSLSAAQVADVEAYIFKVNGFPAGNHPLPPAPPALAGIKITTRPSG